MPTWLQGADSATQDKFRTMYNDGSDVGGYLTQQEQAFRDANTAAGIKTDAGSANVYGSKEFQQFLNGQYAPPQQQAITPAAQQQAGAQSVAQLWTAQPATPAQTQNTDRNNSLWSQLTQRAQQGLNVQDDPVVRAQVDQFRAEQAIAEREYLADLAESEGPLTNLRGEQRMASERRGRTTAGFAAQVAAREVQFRREEIQNALTQMGSMLSDDQKLELQRQLAELDARLRELGIQSDNSYRNAQLQESKRQHDDRFALDEWEALNLDDLRRRGLI
jgi:hypothetical protein